MANSSFTITISTPASVAEMQRFLLSTTSPRNEAVALSGLFKRFADGLWPATFTVQTSASAPVRATDTLTLTYASITDMDTCVVLGTTLTCVTGTPSGAAQFKKQTNATVTAANLVACVNAHTTLNKLVFASSSVGVVTFTLLTYGAIGNQGTLVGSTGMVAGTATFASGAGGSETVAVSYSRG